MGISIYRLDHKSEIYQVTGPVERFAGQIASHGFVVGMFPPRPSLMTSSSSKHLACPSIYHEFEEPDPIPYDVPGASYIGCLPPPG